MTTLMRRLSLRLDEMLHFGGIGKPAEQPNGNGGVVFHFNGKSNGNGNGNGIGAVAEQVAEKQVRTKRKRHPREESFIRSGEYGRIRFHFEKPEHQFITEEGNPLILHDLYTHVIVFGESGCGKTAFVLNQMYEELFRTTHLKDSPERDAKKVGGLVIEAKGDFAPKSWDLGVKYGRAEDVIFFGPNHLDNVYNPFGDETELPQQMADKMQAVMDAFSGGQKSTDPFWPAASRKLFTQIFHLHRKLRENGAKDLSPMSFDLLNLLLLDKGQPRNQGEIDAKARSFQETYEKFNTQMDKAKGYSTRLAVDCGPLADKVEIAIRHAQEELKHIDEEIQVMEEPTAEWRKEIAKRKEAVQRKLSLAGNLKNLLSCEEEEDANERMAPRLERLKKDIIGMGNATDDFERGRYYDNIIENASEICDVIHARIGLVPEASNVDHPDNLTLFKNMLLDLSDALEKIGQIGDQLANWQAPEPAQGMLKTMLNQYEKIVTSKGQNPATEPILAYFYEEHLNPANDKTTGSVVMTASNLVNLFVHHPFNKIFNVNSNFDMAKVIDEGKIIVLDIPQAKYGVIMNITSLIMKVDFYRAILSRKVLYVKDAVTGEQRLVNQERPMTYFCDEFASIASTGDTTGEAGFLDKCREYKCACILAVQSKPMLLKKIKEPEVDAILTNCGIKIFMRNTDEKTTQMASKVLGNEIKVNPYSTQSMTEHALMLDRAIGARGFSSSYQRQPRYDPTKFSELKNGEAIVKLNPRFGRLQTKRVIFNMHIIKSVDKDNLMPFPIVTAVEGEKT